MTRGANGGAAGDFLNDLGDAARRNPISTALIGMGVVWLITGSNPVGSATRIAKRGYDRLPEAARDRADDTLASAQQGVSALGTGLRQAAKSTDDMMTRASTSLDETSSAVRDRVSQIGDGMSDAAADLSARTADLFQAARHRLGDMMEEQPLLLGAIGAAIGAGIAVSLPSTRTESTYFGDAADEFRAKVTAFAGHEVDRVQSAAERAIDEAGQAVRETAGKMAESADATHSRATS